MEIVNQLRGGGWQFITEKKPFLHISAILIFQFKRQTTIYNNFKHVCGTPSFETVDLTLICKMADCNLYSQD